MKIKRNRWLFSIVILSCVLVLFFVFHSRQPLPSYAGKDAAFWFDAYSQVNPPGRSDIPFPGDPSEAFRAMGAAAAPFLVKSLKHADSWERSYGLFWTGLPNWMQKILPFPVNWDAHRGDAAELLAQLGSGATNVVSDLIPLYYTLQKRSTNVAVQFCQTRGGRLFMMYTDLAVRAQLLNIMAAAGKHNPAALDVLMSALQDQDLERTATLRLAKLAAQDEQVIPRLVTELNNTNGLVRKRAALSLGLIGKPAKLALPRLKELVEESREPDRQVRFEAADALWKIDSQAYAIVPFRIEALKSTDDSVRWDTARLLRTYGAQSKPAIQGLVTLLKVDPSNRVRGRAAIVLGQLGPVAGEAVPALKEALKDEFSNVREAATEALKKIESSEVP